MVDGTLTQTTVNWISGFIGVIVLASIVFGFYYSMKKLKKETDADKEKVKTDHESRVKAEVEKAVMEAKKETASEIAFRDLQKSVEAMSMTVKCINDSMDREIIGLKNTDLNRVKWMTEIESSARSAHRRLDEHKAIDHGMPNNHFSDSPRHSVIDDNGEKTKEEVKK